MAKKKAEPELISFKVVAVGDNCERQYYIDAVDSREAMKQARDEWREEFPRDEFYVISVEPRS